MVEMFTGFPLPLQGGHNSCEEVEIVVLKKQRKRCTIIPCLQISQATRANPRLLRIKNT